MIRRFLISLVFASTLLASQGAGAWDAGHRNAGEYVWSCMGCNPSANDPARALSLTGWPEPVQRGLLGLVRSGPGKQVTFATGQHFQFVTQGGIRAGTVLRLDHNVRAQWRGGDALQAADQWELSYGGSGYIFVRFHRCGNWGSPDIVVVPPPLGPPWGQVPQLDCETCCPTS